MGCFSVNNASVTGNTLYDNDRFGQGNSDQGNGDIVIATRFPGNANCHPGSNAVPCDAMRDVQGVTVQDNTSSNARYGINLPGSSDGSTNNVGINAISGNRLNAPTAVVVDQHVTVNTYAISPVPSQVASSEPETIAVFPQGNAPLGVALGTPCTAYVPNTAPPVCSAYSNRGTFQFGANDPGGAYNVNYIEVFLSTGTGFDVRGPGASGPFVNAPFCHLLYVPPQQAGTNGVIYLDQVTQADPASYMPNFSTSSAIGSGAPLSNSACTIYAASSRDIHYSLNDAVLDLDIQFAQNGTYYMYEFTNNNVNAHSSGNGFGGGFWSLWGYWHVGPVQ
ncbi:MAG: hypothetical protein ACR2NN_04090 [Bryobacteraceae bacterium]